ncbi:antibiotic biosynthesis monooxygenase family protein [Nguyenibacter vanlangensis]|uniref:Antibiotic biosynthesis monooxygenase family protein n=1 Tax=Nguyenibacter vanlangensis TaxID=1216886 RepID=A0ABZ3D7H3_9PROT
MTNAAPLTIIAEFATTPENRGKFLEICAYDSARSVADEPGCRAFDVLLPENEPDRVILHEIYVDQAAFDSHLTTPHYQVFADGMATLGVELLSLRRLATHRA